MNEEKKDLLVHQRHCVRIVQPENEFMGCKYGPDEDCPARTTHPDQQYSDELEQSFRKLFKGYSVGVSAGMKATRPKTVDDAEEFLQGCIGLAINIVKQSNLALLDRIEKEVVGEDTLIPSICCDGECGGMTFAEWDAEYGRSAGKNDLRAEQRQKLAAIRSKL